MLKQLMIVGAAILGAGFSLSASAAVSVITIAVECPPTLVGQESICTVNGVPWTDVLTVTFTGSGSRRTESTGAYRDLPQGHFVSTNLTLPSNRCKANTSYSATSACSYPFLVKFKPLSAGVKTNQVWWEWDDGLQKLFTITGTGLDNPASTYAWQSSAFSTCGGPGTWSYGDWLPAVGSACTTALQQTREATCTAVENSSTHTRTVQCVREQDGVTVADTFCTEPKPVTSESCTPLHPNCGPQQAVMRTVSDQSTCTYEWSAQAWSSSCAGGSGAWMPGEWAPSTGCGATHQTRTVSCAVETDSGSLTRAVECVRSDGTSVADASCASQPKPASTQPCTPTSSACGVAPAIEQTVHIQNDCPSGGDGDEGEDDNESPPTGPAPVTKKELCTPDAANRRYCLWMPL